MLTLSTDQHERPPPLWPRTVGAVVGSVICAAAIYLWSTGRVSGAVTTAALPMALVLGGWLFVVSIWRGPRRSAIFAGLAGWAAVVGALAALLGPAHVPGPPSPMPPPPSTTDVVDASTTTTVAPTSTTRSAPTGAVRRRGTLTLRLGYHADLDSPSLDWDQRRSGYQGDVYFYTGKAERKTPRIQGYQTDASGQDYTTLIPLGVGRERTPAGCVARSGDGMDPWVPVDGTLQVGTRLCVRTGEGRWAILTVTDLLDLRRVRFSVVVWEKR